MDVLIVDGGKLAYFLAKSLIAKGQSVVVIVHAPAEAERFARRLKAVVIQGDGTMYGTLRSAGISGMDMVLAMTANDEDNFSVCQLADREFGVPRSFALVNDPDNVRVFRDLGVRPLFSPARLLSSLIEQRVASEAVLNIYPFGEGLEVTLTEIALDENSPAASKPLRDLPLPEKSLVAGIIRSGEAIIPRGNTVLLPGDHLIVSALPDVYASVVAVFTGK